MNKKHQKRLEAERQRACEGKVSHTTRDDAKMALITFRRKFPGTPANIYKCKFCHNWHIGHETKSKKLKNILK